MSFSPKHFPSTENKVAAEKLAECRSKDSASARRKIERNLWFVLIFCVDFDTNLDGSVLEAFEKLATVRKKLPKLIIFTFTTFSGNFFM